MDEMRENWVCGAHKELAEGIRAHGETLRTINDKLDGMIVRQIDYAERSVRIEAKQEQLEKIVTNGLSHTVADMSKRLDAFCSEVRRRLDELETFSWFRTPITKLRDSIFWCCLKIAVAGGVIYLAVHYTGDIVKAVLR